MVEEVLAGVHPVLEALRADQPLNKIWLARGTKRPEVGEILRLAREKGVPVHRVEAKYLRRLVSGIQTQGVVAQLAPRPYLSLEDVLAVAAGRREPAFILALDGVEDPQNFGAILRSAEAAGVHGVVVPTWRAVPATAAVARASAGALYHIPLARVGNLVLALESLRSAGLTVIGLTAEASADFFSLTLRVPLVLVVGSEGKGLRRLVRERCDVLAALPMRGKVNSLNVAAAAAVALYEVVRQRLAQ